MAVTMRDILGYTALTNLIGRMNTPLDNPDFLRAILDTPQDDAPRLVYADWLDEHGECDRAEFIRLQVALEGKPGPADKRVMELYLANRADWFPGSVPLETAPGLYLRGGNFVQIVRGFPSRYVQLTPGNNVWPRDIQALTSCPISDATLDNPLVIWTISSQQDHRKWRIELTARVGDHTAVNPLYLDEREIVMTRNRRELADRLRWEVERLVRSTSVHQVCRVVWPQVRFAFAQRDRFADPGLLNIDAALEPILRLRPDVP